MWQIKPILKCCIVSLYYLRHCRFVNQKGIDLGPTPQKRTAFLLNILTTSISASWPSLQMIYDWRYIQIHTITFAVIFIMTAQLWKLSEYENLNIWKTQRDFYIFRSYCLLAEVNLKHSNFLYWFYSEIVLFKDIPLSWKQSCNAWNYNTNRNNISGNSFIKVFWNRHGLEVERDSL